MTVAAGYAPSSMASQLGLSSASDASNGQTQTSPSTSDPPSQYGPGTPYGNIAERYLGLGAPITGQDLGVIAGNQTLNGLTADSQITADQAKAMGFSPAITGSGSTLQGYMGAQEALDAFNGLNLNDIQTGNLLSAWNSYIITGLGSSIQSLYPQLASQIPATSQQTPAAQPSGVNHWGVSS